MGKRDGLTWAAANGRETEREPRMYTHTLTSLRSPSLLHLCANASSCLSLSLLPPPSPCFSSIFEVWRGSPWKSNSILFLTICDRTVLGCSLVLGVDAFSTTCQRCLREKFRESAQKSPYRELRKFKHRAAVAQRLSLSPLLYTAVLFHPVGSVCRRVLPFSLGAMFPASTCS